MSTVRLILGCWALFALARLSNLLAAEPTPKGNSAKIGAELPEQAVARLGTVRFRHGGPITGLALSNDGKYIASSSGDRTLRIWEAETGKLLRAIRCEEHFGTAIAFSPDGKRIAANVDSESISIFECQTAKPPRRIKATVAYAMAWSPDGKFIGCPAVDDQAMFIFDVLDGKQLHKIIGSGRIAFSPDGKTFAMANHGGGVALHNLANGKRFGELRPRFLGTFHKLQYSRDGQLLIASSDGELVDVWNLKTMKRLHSFKADDSAVFVPGDKAVAAIVDGRLAFFDLQSGEKTLTSIVTGRSSPFVFTGDGNRVFVGGPDSRIAVWNRTTGKEELVGEGDGHAAEIIGLAFGPQADTLISAGYDGIRLWSVKEKKELAGGRRSTIAQALAIAPNGRRFATAGPSSIHIWNPVDLTAAKPFPADPAYKLATKAAKIPFIAYTPDGERIAYAGGDKTLNFADPGRGTDFAALHLSSDALAAAFGPNSRNLAVITRDGLLSYWSTGARGPNNPEPKDRELWKKRVQRSHRAAVAISPNGLLIAASSVGRVQLLESATGRLWQGFDRQLGDGDVGTIAFSPDGRLLAVGHGGPEGVVRVWEVLTGREIVAFRGHLGGVNAVAFAPNGQRIASAGADTSILLWDLTLPAGPEAKSLALSDAWNLLDSDDTKMANQAVGTMITAGDKAVAMIDTGLKNAIENQTRIRKLIAQLDDDDFRIRRSARADLDKEGLRAWPALHEALRRKIPGETERLIKLIIEGMEARGLHAPDSGLFGESLRTVRAINVLERVGGKAAIGVIEKLADAKDDSRIAQEAKAALERLKK